MKKPITLTKNQIKKLIENPTMDLSKLLSNNQKDAIYREIKIAYTAEDVLSVYKDQGCSKKVALEAADYLESKFDCNITYWDNIDMAYEATKDVV